ncbi:MAG: Gfo/Idh/MocA family oxidoreductase [Clostridiaceae bacterium]|nr:Gfo/Idh/MocA family oxidoreductase [Clostridiaceae bacterium]
MANTVRIGVIGMGNMGTAHAKSIIDGKVPGLELAAMADIRATRRDWVQENMSEYPWYDSAEDLIKKSDVDAVLIAVPHYEHVPLSILALEQGKHVLLEKPISVQVSEARRLNAVADRAEHTFAIMFNQRTNPLYRRMRQMIMDGELGAIKRTNWIITTWYRTQSYYDSGDWRATWSGEGGGVLLNQCPHNLDLWQWICGMPNRVRAFCHVGKWHDIEVEDDVTAYVEYPDGGTGVFVTSTADAPGTNRLEIVGDRGKMICENDQLRICRLKVDEREFCRTSQGFQQPEGEWEVIEMGDDNPQHIGILRNFTRHILAGEPLISPGQEGINSLMLSNAMYLSSWLDKAVELPIDDELFDQHLKVKIAGSKRKVAVGSDTITDVKGSF